MRGLFSSSAISFNTSYPPLPLFSSGEFMGSELSVLCKLLQLPKTDLGLRSTRLGVQKHSLILAERKNKNKPKQSYQGHTFDCSASFHNSPPVASWLEPFPLSHSKLQPWFTAEPWPGNLTSPFILTSCGGRMKLHITWSLEKFLWTKMLWRISKQQKQHKYALMNQLL